MRYTLITIAVAVLIASNALAETDVVSWARVYPPNEEVFESVVYRDDLDIASARHPDYVDVIAPQSILDELGLPYEYMQYDCLSPESYRGRGYLGYHNYDELVADMEALATDYPDICALTDMGQGHVELGQLWLLKISDDVGDDDPEEDNLLITGCHHAREPMSVEVPLSFATYLCENYGTDLTVRNLVDNLEFYVMPCMNVDGWIHDDVEYTRRGWRKNGRDNDEDGYHFGSYDGVDLNRNYPYMWGYDDQGSSGYPGGTTYRGPSPGSEPENQTVMGLAEPYEYVSAISFHSFGEHIIKPWSYIDDYTDDDELFDDMTDVINAEIYDHLGHYYNTGNSKDTLGYFMNGEFADYMYGEFSTLAVTIELNSGGQGGFYPDEYWIEPTCDMMDDALVAWACHFYDVPTGVVVEYFTGEWKEGVAELSWDVSDGSTFAGFNLYREPEDGSGKTLVNGSLITGESPFEYEDDAASPAHSYDYYLEAIDESGAATTHGPVHLDALGGTKTAFALYQTSPNPTTGAATFRFSVPSDSNAELAVYDISGRKVATVIDGPVAAGEHSITADLTTVPSGLYFYVLRAGSESAAKKLIVNR
jgi:carboxypeptidase T